MKLLLFCLLILFLPLISFGQIETDRPDQTEASSIVPTNSLQIETGFVWENVNSGEAKSFSGPSILLRYAIDNFFELRVFEQFEHHSFGTNYEISGLSDLELGVKLQLFKTDGSQTEIAFLSHAVIPTAKSELSNQTFGTINKLCVSHAVNDRFGIGYNLGYAYLEENHSFLYSMALGASITDSIGCYIEPFGSIIEGGYFESNFDAGVTYLLKPNLQLDASYGLGLNHNMHYVSVGFSWNLEDVF